MFIQSYQQITTTTPPTPPKLPLLTILNTCYGPTNIMDLFLLLGTTLSSNMRCPTHRLCLEEEITDTAHPVAIEEVRPYTETANHRCAPI